MKLNYTSTTDHEHPIIGEMMAMLVGGFREVEKAVATAYLPKLEKHFGSVELAAQGLINAFTSGAAHLLVETASSSDDPEAALREMARSLTTLPAIALSKKIGSDNAKQFKKRNGK